MVLGEGTHMCVEEEGYSRTQPQHCHLYDTSQSDCYYFCYHGYGYIVSNSERSLHDATAKAVFLRSNQQLL